MVLSDMTTFSSSEVLICYDDLNEGYLRGIIVIDTGYGFR